jgi:hypothetical protein
MKKNFFIYYCCSTHARIAIRWRGDVIKLLLLYCIYYNNTIVPKRTKMRNLLCTTVRTLGTVRIRYTTTTTYT